MLDVGLGFEQIQRTQVVGGDHPLAQLHHLRALHDGAELRLAHQEALQQRVVLELEVGEHAQLLDRLGREVLGLVDDQQGALAGRGGGHQEGLDGEQQIALGQVLAGDPEGGRHQPEDVARVDLGAHQVGGDDLLGVELFEEATDQQGLPCPDLAGDDDEAFVLMQPVFEIGHGTAMAATAVEK